MNEHELALRLQLPAETIRALEKMTVSPEELDFCKSCFWADPAAFDAYADRLPDGLAVLKRYLYLLPDTREAYRQRSIPEEVFWDSCQDFGIWCRDYLQMHGVPGLDQWKWIGLTMRLRLFRLGRLQFEPAHLDREIRMDGRLFPAGTPHLEIHIPAEMPLDPQAVRASLNRAVPFFRRSFGIDYPLFHCHSWLLAPQLRDILPESSRILQFQSLFTLCSHEPARQAEERVFGRLSDDPSCYPADTSLRRRMRQYLMEGHSLGVGSGFRLADTAPEAAASHDRSGDSGFYGF